MQVLFDRPHPETKIDFDLALTITIVHKIANVAGKDGDDFLGLQSCSCC